MAKYGIDPPKFVVYQDWKPKKPENGIPNTSRMGGYNTLEEAKIAIVENEQEMRRPPSYGGLIDWGEDTGQRKYRIYECNYTEVK